METAQTRLPAGRYELTAPEGIASLTIDIYPGGVIYAEHDGKRRAMRLLGQLGRQKKYDISVSMVLLRVVFNPSDSELWAQYEDHPARDLRVTLTTAHRI